MNVAEYFEVLKYVLMFSILTALVLIFLYAFYGKEERED